jgi:RNA polymerase sigma factor (sigma-70 family)
MPTRHSFAAPALPETDGQLLHRFAADGSPDAFAALVRRHGPMVRGVCRRVLGPTAEVDDAYQTTFLVLARRAAEVRRPDRLGPWLHGVAVRVARKARGAVARRPVAADAVADVPAAGGDPAAEVTLREAERILVEELNRLPAELRAALVACYMHGETHEAVARRIGRPVGSVAWVLGRGRQALRAALVERGLTLGLGAVLLLASGDRVRAAVPLPPAAPTPAAPTPPGGRWLRAAAVLLAVLLIPLAGYAAVTALTGGAAVPPASAGEPTGEAAIATPCHGGAAVTGP